MDCRNAGKWNVFDSIILTNFMLSPRETRKKINFDYKNKCVIYCVGKFVFTGAVSIVGVSETKLR